MHLESCFKVSLSLSILTSWPPALTYNNFLIGASPASTSPPTCYLEQATKVQSYKTEHVLCFLWPLSGSKPFFLSCASSLRPFETRLCVFIKNISNMLFLPAYYSRTPLPTVKKEQEILRAKFANPASPSSDPPLPSAPSQPTQP